MKAKTLGMQHLRHWHKNRPHFAVDHQRPKTRADCINGPRPCPFVGCKYHLYLDVHVCGSIKLNFPDKEPWELEETCALDVADWGGANSVEVAVLINVTKQRVKQATDELMVKVGLKWPGEEP